MTDIKFKWEKHMDGGFVCQMPGEVTLFASPERTKGYIAKPVRGTKWRAGASIWNGKDTILRYGRDAYDDKQEDAKAAQRLAETIYLEALNSKFAA